MAADSSAAATIDIPTPGAELVKGLGASPGVVSGIVRVLSDPLQGCRLRDGEILVAPMTNPDWLATLRRTAAVVTDEGGITCHAAIVSRELRIPCVVAARNATTVLHDGQVVTVDGARGVVMSEIVGRSLVATARPAPSPEAPASIEQLATRLYLNVAMTDHVEEIAAMAVDGVGLLRAEFLVTEALGGRHPRAVVAEGGAKNSSPRWPNRSHGSAARSARVRSCTAPSTSARTSSAISLAASNTNHTNTTR